MQKPVYFIAEASKNRESAFSEKVPAAEIIGEQDKKVTFSYLLFHHVYGDFSYRLPRRHENYTRYFHLRVLLRSLPKPSR